MPTKTGLSPQASENCRRALTAWALLAAVSAALAACGDHGGEGKDCPRNAVASAVSGYCVPRYVSLKRDKVYARKGPGVDYPAVWVYRAKGLPVQIVAETLDWRRVCDPDGGAVWVHRSMVDGRRTVQARGPAPARILSAPHDGAHLVAMLSARALANLDRCQGDWCKIKVDGASGWTPAAGVWGVADAAQCR